MKRALAIILSVITIVILVASCNKNTDIPDGMESCTDNDFYTMFMPQGWKKIGTGTDATLIQEVNKGGFTNVSANALYWQITAPDIDGEEPSARNERLFNAYFEKYKSQLIGEYDQLGNGQNKSVDLIINEDKLTVKLVTGNGIVENTYKFQKNGLRLELYKEGNEQAPTNDGYVTVSHNEDGTYNAEKLYYYGVEYELKKANDIYEGYKRIGGIASEFEVLSTRDLTVKDHAAKEYVYTLKYGDLYYKYYTTVILGDRFYYVITFTFPERVSEKGEQIITTREYDDGEYKDVMSDVVTNFIPKK